MILSGEMEVGESNSCIQEASEKKYQKVFLSKNMWGKERQEEGAATSTHEQRQSISEQASK